MKTLHTENCRFAGRGDIHSQASLAISDGIVVEIGRSDLDRPADLKDSAILAGFIDIHNHGAAGVDVNSADVDGLFRAARFLAENGVTAWVPTLVPDTDENYRRVIEAIDQLMERQKGEPIAQAVGVHYEGVFANQTMCGALRPEYFRDGRWAKDGGKLPKLAAGVHMTTLAPEIDGGIELIEQLTADGWVVSIGHTNATPETLERAFRAGARHMTHFFNAMTGLHHRDVGAVGWGLINEGVTFDIIADGVHVEPRMLALACRSKGTGKVSLISDSVAPTGLGDGEYELWDGKISVVNGRTRNDRGSIAGSVSTMLEGARLMLEVGFTMDEVAQMTAANPAKLLGLDDRGSVEIGKRADLVGLRPDGSIEFTMIGGNLVNI